MEMTFLCVPVSVFLMYFAGDWSKLCVFVSVYRWLYGVFSDSVSVTDRVCECKGEGAALFDLLFSIVKGI